MSRVFGVYWNGPKAAPPEGRSGRTSLRTNGRRLCREAAAIAIGSERDRPRSGKQWLGRIAAIAAVAVLTLSGPGSAVLGAPADAQVVVETTFAAGAEHGALLAPLRQRDDNTDTPATTPEPGTESEAGRMATMVAVLNRQGAEGAEILGQIASVNVVNPLPMPEPTIDPGAEQTATANAAATSTAIAEAEVALAVEATVEARATEEAAARRADAQATAAASATAAAAAASVAATATEPAVVATTSGNDDARPPTSILSLASISISLVQKSLSPVLFALASVFAGLLGSLIWRRQREPFVLKAKLVRS